MLRSPRCPNFAGLKLSEPILDETTILSLRHMLGIGVSTARACVGRSLAAEVATQEEGSYLYLRNAEKAPSTRLPLQA